MIIKKMYEARSRNEAIDYTAAAKKMAEKTGEDLLVAILALAADKVYEQIDEYEFCELVDIDASADDNTCELIATAVEDVKDDVESGSIALKGDSGKSYSSDAALAACNDFLGLSGADRISAVYNNAPRHYNHILDEVCTAMDIAMDMADAEDDYESLQKIKG